MSRIRRPAYLFLGWMARLVGLDSPSDDSRSRRTRRMLATGSASTLAQVVALSAGFVVTPLLVRHLGATQYGIYATLTSIVGWLSLAQVGLGPSVLNRLSTAKWSASPKRASTTVSSAIAMQAVISAGLVVALIITTQLTSWGQVFGAPEGLEDVVSSSALLMLLVLAVQLPFTLGKTAFEARQRGYVSQGWLIAVHLVRLTAVAGVVVFDGTLLAAVLAMSLPTLLRELGQFVHAYWFAFSEWRPRVELISWPEGRQLAAVAGDFLILGMSSAVISSTDNFIITHTVGPAAVTPYAVTFRLTQLPTVFIMLALNSAWPAYREAMTTDADWLLRVHRRMRVLGVALPLLFGTALIAVGRPVIELWAGQAAVPSLALLVWLAAIPVVQGVLLPPGRLLTALNRTRLNALTGLANAVVNLVASLLLAREFGAVGVAMGTTIGYSSTGWILLRAARRETAALEMR